MKVLVIDGPARGTVRDVESHRFQVLAINAMHEMRTMETNIDVAGMVYHVHEFKLLGRYLRIASVHLLIDDISPSDAFEIIASDKAKDVAT